MTDLYMHVNTGTIQTKEEWIDDICGEELELKGFETQEECFESYIEDDEMVFLDENNPDDLVLIMKHRNDLNWHVATKEDGKIELMHKSQLSNILECGEDMEDFGIIKLEQCGN